MDMSNERKIFTVSELNQTVRVLLENQFSQIWLEGEISNFVQPASGHWYFTLKDSEAQIRCAMFRGFNRALNFKPEEGMQVVVKAKASLYPGRGDYQLIIDFMEEVGNGHLQRAFEALKKRLHQEGLFEQIHKKPLPAFAKTVGVITSATGAAIRDIIHVMQRRFPATKIIIYPTSVQGKAAIGEICEAIALANSRQECDVLIVGRGGGSLEDLWAYNEEAVARAIFQSRIPIISAVGHEIDFTIADFVADYRAPTPSAAAELVTPDQQHWLKQLQHIEQRLIFTIKQSLQQTDQQLKWLEKRLIHPGQRLQDLTQRLDDLSLRMQRNMHHYLEQLQANLHHIRAALFSFPIQHHLTQQIKLLQLLAQRFCHNMEHLVEHKQQQLAQLSRALNGVSPLATLSRGYAIVRETASHQLIQKCAQTQVGKHISVQLQDGSLHCKIEEIFPTKK